MRRLEPGSPVLLDGHGSIRPTHRDAGYLPIAGGVGITPVLGILRSFADRRDGGPLTLLYASRNDDITFRDELIELQERLASGSETCSPSRHRTGKARADASTVRCSNAS